MSFRSVFGATAMTLLLLARPTLMMAEDPEERITCLVIYDSDLPGGGHQFDPKNLSVKQMQLSSLSAAVPALQPYQGEKRVPESEFHGTVTNSAKTKGCVSTEVYEGEFKMVKVDTRYVPYGGVTVLKPQLFWPGGDNYEHYTTASTDGHLRALWTRLPLVGKSAEVSDRYFAVAVQIYKRQRATRSAVFTGTKKVESGTWPFKDTTSTNLKNEQLMLNDTQWIDDGMIQVSCAPIRIKE